MSNEKECKRLDTSLTLSARKHLSHTHSAPCARRCPLAPSACSRRTAPMRRSSELEAMATQEGLGLCIAALMLVTASRRLFAICSSSSTRCSSGGSRAFTAVG